MREVLNQEALAAIVSPKVEKVRDELIDDQVPTKQRFLATGQPSKIPAADMSRCQKRGLIDSQIGSQLSVVKGTERRRVSKICGDLNRGPADYEQPVLCLASEVVTMTTCQRTSSAPGN